MNGLTDNEILEIFNPLGFPSHEYSSDVKVISCTSACEFARAVINAHESKRWRECFRVNDDKAWLVSYINDDKEGNE